MCYPSFAIVFKNYLELCPWELSQLKQWFSKCGPQTSSISITWEPMGNANSQAPPQTTISFTWTPSYLFLPLRVPFLRICLHSLPHFLTFYSALALAHSHWASTLRGPQAAMLVQVTGPLPGHHNSQEPHLRCDQPTPPCLFSRLSLMTSFMLRVELVIWGSEKRMTREDTGLQYFHLLFHFPFHTKCPSTFSSLAEGSFLYLHWVSSPTLLHSGTDSKPLSATDNLNTKTNNQPTNLESSHAPARDGVGTTPQFILTSGKQQSQQFSGIFTTPKELSQSVAQVNHTDNPVRSISSGSTFDR